MLGNLRRGFVKVIAGSRGKVSEECPILFFLDKNTGQHKKKHCNSFSPSLAYFFAFSASGKSAVVIGMFQST